MDGCSSPSTEAGVELVRFWWPRLPGLDEVSVCSSSGCWLEALMSGLLVWIRSRNGFPRAAAAWLYSPRSALPLAASA